MRKRDWLIVILPLLVVWGLDRITKVWASTLQGYHDHGLMAFILHHNHGAMLGLFSELPTVLRVVSLSTGGAFLIFSYLIIQYLLPFKSLVLRVGMSTLLGGILGNVWDRIIYGYVIDFLVFKWDQSHSPAMNIADVLQWFGYFMIVYALIKEGKNLWPEINSRKSFWINKQYQKRFSYLLTMIGAGICIIAGTFSYTYLRVSLESIPSVSMRLEKQLLGPYVITFLIISFTFCIILFYIGLVLSHRAAGPIYAFEKFLEDIADGKLRRLRLRAGDEFSHLEAVADKLLEKLQAQAKAVNNNDSNIESALQNQESFDLEVKEEFETKISNSVNETKND